MSYLLKRRSDTPESEEAEDPSIRYEEYMSQRGDCSFHFELQQCSIPEWNIIGENTSLQEAERLQASLVNIKAVASSRKREARATAAGNRQSYQTR
jgi:hypothetical protein